MTVVSHIVNYLYLNTGGLSKKPGQVCDSRVIRTVHHPTTKARRTHIQTQALRERLCTETKRRQCSVYVSRVTVLFNAIFFLNSRVSHCCILFVSHCLIFSETFSIIVMLLLKIVMLLFVRGGRFWAGTG